MPAKWTGMIAFVREVPLDRLRIHVVVRAHIDEHRPRAEVCDYLGRRGEGQCRHDHLVGSLESNRLQREVKRGRARIQHYRVLYPERLGESRLEFLRPWSCGQPA